MTKKINTNLVKLIKYYSLINHNLIYENEAINRYKINSNLAIKGPKGKKLQELKDLISKIKDCELKKISTNIVFSDGNPNAKIMVVGEGPGANEDFEGVPFIGRTGELLEKTMLVEFFFNSQFLILTIESLSSCNLLPLAPLKDKLPLILYLFIASFSYIRL